MKRTRFFTLGILVLASSLDGRLEVTLAAEPGGHGGGDYVLEADSPDLTEEQRSDLGDASGQHREAPGRGCDPGRAGHPGDSPDADLAAAGGSAPANYGYHAIRNYVDHNPSFPVFVLDYECGDRTCDTGAGYNHQGTDFFNWPFPWLKMDRGDVEIIAAAPGVITFPSPHNTSALSGGFRYSPTTSRNFLDELRIAPQLERPHPVRLQTVGVPDPPDRRLAHALGAGHGSTALARAPSAPR